MGASPCLYNLQESEVLHLLRQPWTFLSGPLTVPWDLSPSLHHIPVCKEMELPILVLLFGSFLRKGDHLLQSIAPSPDSLEVAPVPPHSGLGLRKVLLQSLPIQGCKLLGQGDDFPLLTYGG